jgi:Ca2+-binding RTX toxin-like protein
MALTATQSKSMYQFFALAFNAAPGVTYMNQLDAAINSGMSVTQVVEAFTSKAEFTSTYPGFLSNEAFATRFINNNVGSFATDAAKTAAIADIAAALNAGWSRGKTITQVFTNISNLPETDATWGNVVKLVNNKVAYAQYYTETMLGGAEATPVLATLRAVIANVTPTTSVVVADMAAVLNPAPVPVAQTFTLTTGTDNFVGTSGNDTFNAPNAAATAVASTMNTVDTLVGGAGTDTLNISGQEGAATVALSNVSGVEVVNVFDTTGVTTSLLGSTGVTTVNSKNSTVATTFSNIASTSVELGVNASAVGATFGFTAAAVAGTADSATLRLNSQTAGTNVVAGVETLNVVSQGSANVLTALTAANATTINISGDQTLNLGAANTVATTISSTNSAGVTLTSNNAAAVTITGGGGADAITLTEGAAASNNINGGAGNDTVTFTANLDTGDTVAGGDGTDTLVALSADLAAVTYTNVSGFENLTVSDALAATLTTATVQAGIARVNFAAAVATQAVTFEAGAKTISLNLVSAAGAQTLTVNDTGTATTDSLTLLNGTAASDVFFGSDILAINGFETVTVNTSTTTAAGASVALGAIGLTPDTGGTATLNFIGNNSVVTGIITATSAAAGVVDASGLTGTRTFSNVGAATVGITSITGSANSDVIVGSATATTINGGAGNDTITGGAAADSIGGGAGNDVIVGGGGNDVITAGDGNDSISVIAAAGVVNIDGGAGNDTILSGGFITVTDLINGGDGTDTLTLLNADLTALNALSISNAITMNDRISNIESITLGDDAAQSIDVGRLDSLSTVNVGDIDGAMALSGLAATNLVTSTALLDNALTLTLADSTGTTDRINYVTSSAAGFTSTSALIVTSAETVGITSNDSDATTSDAADVIILTAADATSIVVDGDSATLTLTLTGTVAMTSLNSTAYTGALTAISLSTVNSTIEAGAGADVLTGGSGADVINGNTGADTLTGGAGADTINGGVGADSLVGGTGADSLTGGEGADALVGGAGNDTITLTETTAAIDDVQLATAATNGVDTIIGFAVGTGIDTLSFATADTTVVTGAGAAAFETLTVTTVTGATYDLAAANAGSTATMDVYELLGTNASNGDLSLVTNGTELLKLLGTTDSAATSITVDADLNKFFIVAYDNGNAYVYNAVDSATAGVLTLAADITLVAVVSGVAVGGFTAGDFLTVG